MIRWRNFYVVSVSTILVLTTVLIFNDSVSYHVNIYRPDHKDDKKGPIKVPFIKEEMTGVTHTSAPMLAAPQTTTERVMAPNPFKCYRNPGNLSTLPNIETRKVTPGMNIVFLETFCTSQEKGKIYLSPRQACAVESAALRNPNLEVHLMFTASATLRDSNATEDKILEALSSYQNIFMSRIDLDLYFAGTPIEELYKSGLMETSKYPGIHLSDVLRFLTMWKYGSIYLDLDVITLRSFEDIEPNFTGIEYEWSLAAGVMNFAAGGKGHEWADMILEYINVNFDPKTWSGNANGAITKLLQVICNTTLITKMTPERCQGFHVHGIEVFYPLDPREIEDFFNPKNIREGLAVLQNARTLHMWNSLTKQIPVKTGDNSAYEIMFMQNCPRVYSQISSEIKF